MARIARVVVPDLPHHVTQRGNRRETVCFGAEYYRLYRRLIAMAARRAGAAIWAYCLMPNHVHLIVTPADGDGLRATLAEAHRRYTAAINARFHWTGHLFQGRFGAMVMDELHLVAAARYITLNPVVAGLVSRAEDWPWSSARAHLTGEDDELAIVAPLRARIPDFAALLTAPADPVTTTRIERAPTIGRPLGAPEWIAALERGSAAAWHRASPGQNERNGTPRGSHVCCERSSKLSPQPRVLASSPSRCAYSHIA
jgi:putative transposase